MSGANECEAPIFRLLREDAPNPKQIQFFEADKQHICYGGARGGGKSWAMRRKFVMLSMRYAGLKLLLLRADDAGASPQPHSALAGGVEGLRAVQGRRTGLPFPQRLPFGAGLLRQ